MARRVTHLARHRAWHELRSVPPAGVQAPPAGHRQAGKPTTGDGRSRGAKIRVLLAIGAASVVAAAVALGAGAIAPSPEPAVKAFLFAWETAHYRAAAAMTTGRPAAVAQSLADAYRQLDAADLVLAMAGITVHGSTAEAFFDASVDLGRGGLPWTYQGRFQLRRAGAGWKVVWSPAVIVPGLRSGQRLAVLTTLPGRAPLLDARGQPLTQPSPVYRVGVRPDRLAHPMWTTQRLAGVIGLGSQADQMRGQILAAPPASFLELVQLDPADYQRLSGPLSKVPGLIIRRTTTLLFDSIAPAITGGVGTENSRVLLNEGVPYRPGATVGLSNLEQAYQRVLAGTATTEIEVQTALGRRVAVLKRWPGKPGVAVRTTIDSAVQRAAQRALAGQPGSAAIVAIRAGTGQILAVSDHAGYGLPAVSPLAGKYLPGQSFTMISTAALLSAGFKPGSQVPCVSANQVAGRTFSNSLPEPDLGPLPPFRLDFEHACSTAFVGPSLLLTSAQLANTACAFGIGSAPSLPLPSFGGSIQALATSAQKTADVIGLGSVRVSPLGMALAAGLVQSGTWRPPWLVSQPADPPSCPARTPIRPQVISQLRQLLAGTVSSGIAGAARVPGRPVSGIVGLAPLGTAHKGVYADWFVGYRGNVAFAVLVFTRAPADVAAQLAGQFAAGLPR